MNVPLYMTFLRHFLAIFLPYVCFSFTKTGLKTTKYLSVTIFGSSPNLHSASGYIWGLNFWPPAQLGRAPINLEWCCLPCGSRVQSPVMPKRQKFWGVQQSHGLKELISSSKGAHDKRGWEDNACLGVSKKYNCSIGAWPNSLVESEDRRLLWYCKKYLLCYKKNKTKTFDPIKI